MKKKDDEGSLEKLTHFSYFICRIHVFVLVHGLYQKFKFFPGFRHFSSNSQLKSKILGWRVLEFEKKTLCLRKLWSGSVLEKSCFVIHLRQCPFIGDWLAYNGDVLPILTKICLGWRFTSGWWLWPHQTDLNTNKSHRCNSEWRQQLLSSISLDWFAEEIRKKHVLLRFR